MRKNLYYDKKDEHSCKVQGQIDLLPIRRLIYESSCNLP